MKNKIILITIMIISILISCFSGCTEQKKDYNQFSFSIENHASYEIIADIIFQGNGFNYNKEIIIGSLETNSTFFPIKQIQQLINYKITVYYNDYEYHNIKDEINETWTINGEDSNFKFRVFGLLNPDYNSSIWIQGPI